MSDTIISSLISGGIALLVCILTNQATVKRAMTIVEVKLDALSKTVEKHNSVVERTFRLEERTAEQEKRLDSLQRELHELSR